LTGRILTIAGKAERDEEWLPSAIESVLLVATEPVSVAALVAATQQPRASVERAIRLLGESLRGGSRLQRQGPYLQLVTAPENVEVVQRFLGAEKPAPLSRSAMETLMVGPYNQPVTRADIEAARGVDCDHSLRRLLAGCLIEEAG